MIRHRSACGGYDAIGIYAAFCGDGLLQRRVAVSAVSVDFELIDGDAEFAEREGADAAGGKVVAGLAVKLGPLHVVGVAISHEVIARAIGKKLSSRAKAL